MAAGDDAESAPGLGGADAVDDPGPATSAADADVASSAAPSSTHGLLPGWVTWLFKQNRGRAVLAAAGVLVYGVVRLCIESFYSQFGLSPTDVGLTKGAILERAALYLALFLSVLLASLSLTAGLIMRLVELWEEMLEDRRKRPATGHRVAKGHTRLLHVPHPDALELRPVLWSLFVLVALLPVALPVLAPDLTAWIVARDPVSRPPTSALRLSFGAWSSSLSVLGYLALSKGCPYWNRFRLRGRDRRWSLGSIVVFVPFLFVVVVSWAWPERTGNRGFLHDAFFWIVVAWPLLIVTLVASALWRHRRRVASRLGASTVLSSLLFYLLILPVALAVLSPRTVKSWFPHNRVLLGGSDSITHRLQLATTAFGVLPWLALVLIAAVFTWRLGGCASQTTNLAREPRSMALALFGASAMVALALLLLADARGKELATRVQHGRRLPSGLALLSAEPACVEGASLPRAGPYMYLGEAHGKLVLYDPLQPISTAPEAILVPSTGVRVTLLRSSDAVRPIKPDSCPPASPSPPPSGDGQ